MVEFLFNKVAALKAQNFIKKKLRDRCFPVNIAKFLRTPFLQNTSGGCFCNVHVIVLCNLGPSRPKQNYVGYFPSKSVVRRCSVKNIFLKTSQNSQKNTCARVSFLNKVTGTCIFLWTFAKFLRTPFFTEQVWATASVCNVFPAR